MIYLSSASALSLRIKFVMWSIHPLDLKREKTRKISEALSHVDREEMVKILLFLLEISAITFGDLKIPKVEASSWNKAILKTNCRL